MLLRMICKFVSCYNFMFEQAIWAFMQWSFIFITILYLIVFRHNIHILGYAKLFNLGQYQFTEALQESLVGVPYDLVKNNTSHRYLGIITIEPNWKNSTSALCCMILLKYSLPLYLFIHSFRNPTRTQLYRVFNNIQLVEVIIGFNAKQSDFIR